MWSLAPGAHLTISNPHNSFVLSPGRPDYILVAGGIGITPIFTLALALLQTGARFRVLYACRRHSDLALADELREQISARLELFVSEEGRRIDLAAQIAKLAPGGELYVCGPIGMLEGAKRDWRRSGHPVDQLRFETFGNSGLFASEPFTVKIPRLGMEINVPRNRTMLEALEAAGVEMISDCRRGECGLCAPRSQGSHPGPSDRGCRPFGRLFRDHRFALWLAFRKPDQRPPACGARSSAPHRSATHRSRLGCARYIPLAPLHQPNNLAPIRTILELRPELPQVACFVHPANRRREHPGVERDPVDEELNRKGGARICT